jgi:hypothetical protein
MHVQWYKNENEVDWRKKKTKEMGIQPLRLFGTNYFTSQTKNYKYHQSKISNFKYRYVYLEIEGGFGKDFFWVTQKSFSLSG